MTDHDPIEALLKATGPRPAVPKERADRVRAATRTAWRRQLAESAGRRRTRWVISLAAAAIVVVAVGLGLRSLGPSTTTEHSGIRVERVANAAWARHGSLPVFRSRAPLHVGVIVPWNSEVMTGADARLSLRSSTGHSLRLDIDTTLRVVSDRVFALERGAVYVESSGETATPESSLRIDTAVGTIEEVGTQFEVRVRGRSLSLRVREGAASLQLPAERIVAHAGQSLRVDASGRIALGEDAVTGGGWAWVEAIAPMMVIDGRTLSEFLEWIARERGVRLQFSDTSVAEKAPAITLKGSIAGMTLEEATTAVLPSCGANHRWEPGVLVIGMDPEGPRFP